MSFQDYSLYDGLGLGELVRRGEVTASELLEEAIARVERHNGKINAVVYKFYDKAREAARRKRPRGVKRSASGSGFPSGPRRFVIVLNLKMLYIKRQNQQDLI